MKVFNIIKLSNLTMDNLGVLGFKITGLNDKPVQIKKGLALSSPPH